MDPGGAAAVFVRFGPSVGKNKTMVLANESTKCLINSEEISENNIPKSRNSFRFSKACSFKPGTKLLISLQCTKNNLKRAYT
jgi:hypothetical protein